MLRSNWWGEKWSVFRGSFKPESEFIWSNITLNRSFCDFRCLESEFWKRGYFGRFWSIKWRKRQSTKNPSWKCKLTASRVYSWRRQTRWIFYRRLWRRQMERWRRQSGQEYFTVGGDGVTKAVTSGSRASEEVYGGEVTASELTLDAVRTIFLYIVF